eukprot:6113607-Pyramimonas_sp.AAC.1
MIIEGVQAPHGIVWFVCCMSAYPAESFTQLFESVIGCRKDFVLPALLRECLVHRAHRWELPQSKSIPDHTRSPT